MVGLAGLLGSGRTEIARLLFGADHAATGTVRIGGEQVTLRTPRIAMSKGVAFCSENRREEGLVPELTVRENLILALQAARGWSRPVPRKKQDELVAQVHQGAEHPAGQPRDADPEPVRRQPAEGPAGPVAHPRTRLLILDEPTRGIDVGAKAEIQKLVVELSDGGMAVLFISAELDEVLRLSHKVAVLRDRRVVAELPNDDTLTTDVLMETIASGAADNEAPRLAGWACWPPCCWST